MARGLMRFVALLTVLAVIFAFASCGKNNGPKLDVKLTDAEKTRIIDLARTFRIFGEYSKETGFELRQYEYMLYSLYTWSLEECEVRGYGRVSIADADEAFASVIGPLSREDMRRTKYKPSEIQVIYTIGDFYYVQLSDDGEYTYTVDYARLLTDEAGERTGIYAVVDVKGGEGDFALAFELMDGANTFSVKKCQIQSYK